ncbi:MAG: crotonase/enoyl-CoA hydratase family protein [Candidatus Promineifilaceae bacterium]
MHLNGTAKLAEYETFLVDVVDKVAYVRLNRPKNANALNAIAWQELEHIFKAIDKDKGIRVAILSGEGKHFCAGIDLSMLMAIRQDSADECEGRMRENIRDFAKVLQGTINAIEECRKPVLAAVHNAAVGGAIDIITACDMRYAVDGTFFAIAEIDMGMVADLGTLQRLPKIIGEGICRELAYTGRRMYADEAKEVGFVNKVYTDKETMMADVTEIARMIASKSPLSIRGTKQVLNYTRDHTVADGLEYIATWNAAMILSNDLNEAFMAKVEKRSATFKD